MTLWVVTSDVMQVRNHGQYLITGTVATKYVQYVGNSCSHKQADIYGSQIEWHELHVA
jgi:hypothetical protein